MGVHFVTLIIAFLLLGIGDSVDEVVRLLHWAEANGANVSNIAVASDGRTLVAKHQYEVGNVMMAIPTQLIITESVARKSLAYQKYIASMPNTWVCDCLSTILFVMFEKLELNDGVPTLEEVDGRITTSGTAGAASFWKPYIDSLPPVEYNFNMPQIEWTRSSDAYKILETSKTMKVLMNMEDNRNSRTLEFARSRIFSHMLHLNSSLDLKTVESTFNWSMKIMSSRSWSQVIDTIPSECNLVPVCDMLNHRDDDADGLKALYIGSYNNLFGVGINAGRKIESHQELIDSYDPYTVDGDQIISKACAQEIFLTFGFISVSQKSFSTDSIKSNRYPGSRDWCVMIGLSIPIVKSPNSVLHESRVRLLKSDVINNAIKNRLDKDREDSESNNEITWLIKFRSSDISIPSVLLQMLRISVANENTLDYMSSTNVTTFGMINYENEVKVMNILKAFANELQYSDDSTEENDIASLSYTNDSNIKEALIIRIHERRLIESLFQYIDERTTSLDIFSGV